MRYYQYIWVVFSLFHWVDPGKVGTKTASWLDQQATLPEAMRGVLEGTAEELSKQPSLETEVNLHLRETVPQYHLDSASATTLERKRLDIPRLRKLELLYSQVIDHRPGLPKAWAGCAVAYFDKMKCAPVLMEALKHPSIDVQCPAATALGKLVYRPAAGPLMELLRRNNLAEARGEMGTARLMFRRELIGSLAIITGLELKGIAPGNLQAVDQFLRKCEDWLAKHPQPPTRPATRPATTRAAPLKAVTGDDRPAGQGGR